MKAVELARIRAGTDWYYNAQTPAGLWGHVYHVHAIVLDVPSYQQKVFCECLTGPDEGLLFVVSLVNFARRYKPYPLPPPPPVEEKVVGAVTLGSGV